MAGSGAASQGEIHVAGVLGIKLFGPCGPVVDGIEQVHGSITFDFVKYGGYHAICMAIAPAVDDVQAVALSEVQRCGLGVVVLLHVALVLRNEADAHGRIDIDAVGNLEGHARIHIGGLICHLLAVGIDGGRIIAQSEHFHDLAAGLSVGACVEHTQQVGHTDG